MIEKFADWWIGLSWSASFALMILTTLALAGLFLGLDSWSHARRRREYRRRRRIAAPVSDSRSSIDLFNWFNRGGRK